MILSTLKTFFIVAIATILSSTPQMFASDNKSHAGTPKILTINKIDEITKYIEKLESNKPQYNEKLIVVSDWDNTLAQESMNIQKFFTPNLLEEMITKIEQVNGFFYILTSRSCTPLLYKKMYPALEKYAPNKFQQNVPLYPSAMDINNQTPDYLYFEGNRSGCIYRNIIFSKSGNSILGKGLAILEMINRIHDNSSYHKDAIADRKENASDQQWTILFIDDDIAHHLDISQKMNHFKENSGFKKIKIKIKYFLFNKN